jgi:hypothetical protein
MRAEWGEYSPGEDIKLGDPYLCKIIYHLLQHATEIADVLGAGIFY